VPAVVAMVHELAEYERAPELCRLTETQLHQALFPAPSAAGTARSSAGHPALFGHVATIGGTPQGFALWFLNFSTWEGVHGIYLEDLYVRPTARGSGAGRALLAVLADLCVRRGYSRLEWWVLHWNPTRDFYHSIGAVHMDEWLPYRLSGPALRRLAATRGA
jgi:GNAT superfamily N-acetyltransferase